MAFAAALCSLQPSQSFAGIGVDRQIGDSTTYYVDPEFWGPTGQVTWQDNITNEGWIANIDPNTGDLIPADGRGIRVPIVLAPIFTNSSGAGSYNGPEFGYSQQGLFVYMTVRDSKGVNQAGRYGPLDRGTPVYKQLSTNKKTSLAVLPAQDSAYPIGAYLCDYFDSANGRAVWRFDNEPTASRTIPIAYIGLKGPRWIKGQLAVSSNWIDSQGYRQAAIIDLALNKINFITNDASHKSEVFVFDCPETGTRAAMCVAGAAQRELAVYKEAAPFWEKIASFPCPSFLLGGGPQAQIYLPEPFVFQGHSYFMFVVGRVDISSLSVQGPSLVYVAKLGSSQAVQVGNTFPAARLDPEVMILNNKAFLYYYTGVPAGLALPPALRAQLHVVTNFLPP